jgi:hypothetical protein
MWEYVIEVLRGTWSTPECSVSCMEYTLEDSGTPYWSTRAFHHSFTRNVCPPTINDEPGECCVLPFVLPIVSLLHSFVCFFQQFSQYHPFIMPWQVVPSYAIIIGMFNLTAFGLWGSHRLYAGKARKTFLVGFVSVHLPLGEAFLIES